MPSVASRKIRLFFFDRDATDSSSGDDDDDQRKKKKTVVREILLPKVVSKSNRFKPAPAPSLKKPKRSTTSKYRGVRLRRDGRWVSEIRDRARKNRVWVGSFQTEDEAHIAYEAAALRLEEQEESPASSAPKKPVVTTQLPSAPESLVTASRTLPTSTQTSPSNDVSCVSSSSVVSDKTQEEEEKALLLLPPDEWFGSLDGIPIDDDMDFIGLADISGLALPYTDDQLDLDLNWDFSFL